MEPPSLEEMVGATIEPMIETTGNQVDMDVFLNPPEPETEHAGVIVRRTIRTSIVGFL